MALIPMEFYGGGTARFIDVSTPLIATLDADFSPNAISYTATEDCWVNYRMIIKPNSIYAQVIMVGSKEIAMLSVNTTGASQNAQMGGSIPLKKGQTIVSRGGYDTISAIFNVYKMLD